MGDQSINFHFFLTPGLVITDFRGQSKANVGSVSPALARFGREAITEDLWNRDVLSPRDRSIVTVAMPIARTIQTRLSTILKSLSIAA